MSARSGTLALSPFRHPGEAFAAVQLGLHVACRAARDPEELSLHHEIRRRVFAEEQGLFDGSDRDDHDDDAATVRILGLCGEVAGGAVRCYPLTETPTGDGAVEAVDLGAGLWKGDRLAVLPSFRHNGLGAPLVRFAVRTAAEAGGRKMIAHIQPSNVGFFEHLGWYAVGEPVSYVGRPHQTMAIDLAVVLRRL
ncbi:MAG TPA: MSMEG_0567/Sll0786 family nitrogen starvation N-acetyltransferase [Actinomycetota bacterium]|jgi:putative N-acetyltransferase (TIGR04045 family)|nr:MSMEG_0567/Sll0786 family nitrogen starvation N-acetyltransferase [Actinomycetota bacterium]